MILEVDMSLSLSSLLGLPHRWDEGRKIIRAAL
jgi:hypothetical protein